MTERLQKILSARGMASRRKAEEWISAGRVTVNGEMAVLGQSADPETDCIAVDGVYIPQREKFVYILLNKPRGYLTTMHDEFGRPTVAQLIRDIGVMLHPVGRLDKDSEGLLILTNDGSFTNSMTHPSFEKEKTYHVTVRGDILSVIKPLGRPMDLDGYITRPAEVKLIRAADDGGILEITIHEGRNRQIRKMCAQTGLQVTRLVRTAADGIRLGRLKSGTWRHLTPDEINRVICTNNCKNESQV